MEIKELLDKKIELEEALQAAIHPLVMNFHDQTGISISRVEVSCIDVSTYGLPEQFILGLVRVELAI